MSSNSVALQVWRGAALATLFLYPLISGLSDTPFYFQWRLRDTAEFAFTFVVLGGVGAGALLGIERIRQPHLRLSATLVLCALPFGSFATQVGRQLGLQRALGAGGGTMVLAAAAATVLVFGFAALRRPELLRKAVSIAILVLSPITLLSVYTVARQSFDPVTIEFESTVHADGAELADVFVLVFDELDYDFLYEKREIRDELPNLFAFAAQSDNHHSAHSPGRMTISSMPGLLAGRRGLAIDARTAAGVFGSRVEGGLLATDISHGNIFELARARGYHTAMVGWGLPYCEMVGDSLDACRSFSSYSYSSAIDSLSPFAPVATTMILLPFQRPFGFLKSAGAAPHQRHMVAATYEFAVAALSGPAPLFLLAHFSIPHDPFVFDGDGYQPADDPFLQNRANYNRQLRYVDRLFGRFVAELEARDRFDAATVIVASDHGYRSQKQSARYDEIPLLVKHPHQTTRRDVSSPTQSEILLREVVGSWEALHKPPDVVEESGGRRDG